MNWREFISGKRAAAIHAMAFPFLTEDCLLLAENKKRSAPILTGTPLFVWGWRET